MSLIYKQSHNMDTHLNLVGLPSRCSVEVWLSTRAVSSAGPSSIVVLLVVMIVVPKMDAFTLRFLIMPLDFSLKVGMFLACLTMLMSRDGMFMVTTFVPKFPCLLLRHFAVLIVLSICMAMMMAGCCGQIACSWTNRNYLVSWSHLI